MAERRVPVLWILAFAAFSAACVAAPAGSLDDDVVSPAWTPAVCTALANRPAPLRQPEPTREALLFCRTMRFSRDCCVSNRHLRVLRFLASQTLSLRPWSHAEVPVQVG
jgi:hypothetical protein